MDIAIVLVIVLVIVVVWRGPKTLPSLGKAFGQGVREARKEIDGAKGDESTSDAAQPVPPPAPPAVPPPAPPAPPAAG
jgi:Sec-independent protein translocase protein TatA